jgi:hypothetical protein
MILIPVFLKIAEKQVSEESGAQIWHNLKAVPERSLD